jgi:hypothetical protein
VVATTTNDGDDVSGGCCLSLSVLSLDARGLTLELQGWPLGNAEALQVLDVEGDGIDELLVTEFMNYPEFGPPEGRFSFVRQVDGGFEAEPLQLPDGTTGWLSGVGEMDGVAGDDLLFLDPEVGDLLRVARDGDAFLTDVAHDTAFIRPPTGGWLAGAANGTFVWVDERGMSTIRWPRGEAPERLATIETQEFPSVFLMGEGENARLIVMKGLDRGGFVPLGLDVYDLDFQLLSSIPVPETVAAVWEIGVDNYSPLDGTNRFLYPLAGPLPGGLGPDRPAFLGFGSLIVLEPDGSVGVQPAAPMLGGGAMGIAGGDGAWMAVGSEWFGPGTNAYLGNYGYVNPDSTIAVGLLADVLDPAGPAPPEAAFTGATLVGDGDDRRLFTSGEEFQVTVAAPPGALVVVVGGPRPNAVEVVGTAATLTIDPPGRDDRNREFEAGVLVVGPTGIASFVSWPAVALRVPPEVTATASIDLLSLRATVTGRMEGDATLTVDGREVIPSSSGRFRVEVDAPAWPRDVLIVARDPVGNETVQRLEIIGFVDYRGLPWIPIVGVATVLAGILLFVRTPSLRPEARLVPDGDGRLEEIDGDLV